MAPASKSSTGAKRRSSANSRNSKSTSSKRTSANSRSTKSRSSNSTSAPSKNGATAKLSSAGHTVAEAASKAKTPLIAGGAALAGAAGGILVKNRTGSSRGPLAKLPRGKLPSMPSLNLSKVDLETVKSTAERVGSLSRQAADIADAAEKTRKKNG
jgi:hypothetical protein